MTTAEFIEKAKAIHGDKYDYSKVNYVNAKTKVCIICPQHGEFMQTPSGHLSGRGCSKCGGSGKLTTEDFIQKAREVHGDKYDYSKVEYVNATTKVCIICPEHGEFWQKPNGHLSKNGCPKCGYVSSNNAKRKTASQFIEESKKIHGDKYDYSKTIYTDWDTPVTIICPIHGEFTQKPAVHLRGGGCMQCARDKMSTDRRFSKEEFIRKAKEVHGDKYDYSKVNYVNNHTEVCIICPIHGEFWQKPFGHLDGNGCQKCAGKEKITTEDFIKKAREIHGDKYNYSKVKYTTMNDKVCIICPIHGEFWQVAKNHLNGFGCSCCTRGLTKQYKFNLLQEFKNEYEFSAFLENNDVNILYVILSAIEPKYDPLKRDIERALNNAGDINPIKALEDKYTSDADDEDDSTDNDSVDDFTAATEATIDLDDDDAVDTVATVDKESEEESKPEPTIDDIIKNTEKEIKVINKIEHLLAPEIRKYIMDKFLNDKRRTWMLEREKSVK